MNKEMTDPAQLPTDVKVKLLAIRDALVIEDYDEAWHQLYSIACPSFQEFEPWAKLENVSQ
ncbi:MAG: hypothetical protein M3Q99_16835 [Acidobacteriota bacterium]|nr:hypothetical protein [Acidobacteriota bacterium]